MMQTMATLVVHCTKHPVSGLWRVMPDWLRPPRASKSLTLSWLTVSTADSAIPPEVLTAVAQTFDQARLRAFDIRRLGHRCDRYLVTHLSRQPAGAEFGRSRPADEEELVFLPAGGAIPCQRFPVHGGRSVSMTTTTEEFF